MMNAHRNYVVQKLIMITLNFEEAMSEGSTENTQPTIPQININASIVFTICLSVFFLAESD